MEFSIIPDQEALSKCTWCQNYIGDETDAFGIGVKLTPKRDLVDYETHCIEILLGADEKPVHMLVTPEGSEAKNDGHDGMFLVCSEPCGNSLMDAVTKEISSGDFFESIKEILG